MDFKEPLKGIKVDVASYADSLDPEAFHDWLQNLEAYFEWYHMSDASRIRFAKMKLVGFAKRF